ncbi:MAG: hypothetical protein KDI63_02740 [Gammaproteobacteria bacterium]|nr:hypothetical protein [Gammaproteobacteria bacterium]
MSVTAQDVTLQEDISAIEKKRRVLEQIVAITHAIEHLQASLDSVLVLGMASKEIPENALSLYSSLNENLRNLPVKKIQEYQKNLEAVIRQQLDKILQLSGIDFNSDQAIANFCRNEDVAGHNSVALLEDFKRTAQTAVSLRVLLRKRGVPTSGTALPVPKAVIVQQLEQLDRQEQQQRAKVKIKIEEMQQDIDRMLENPTYPSGMKQILASARENLGKDIEALDAGAALGTLSFVADVQNLTAIGEEQSDGVEIVAAPVKPERELSFSATASRWLNSPWDVSWQKIKDSGDC